MNVINIFFAYLNFIDFLYFSLNSISKPETKTQYWKLSLKSIIRYVNTLLRSNIFHLFHKIYTKYALKSVQIRMA